MLAFWFCFLRDKHSSCLIQCAVPCGTPLVVCLHIPLGCRTRSSSAEASIAIREMPYSRLRAPCMHFGSLLPNHFVRKLRARWANRCLQTTVALAVTCFALGCGRGDPSSDPSQPAFTNANLKGNYTYKLAGTYFSSTSGSGSYSEAGTFVADGNGNITDGVDDFVQSSGGASGSVTGSYAMAKDGTGMMTLNLPRGTVQIAVTLTSGSSLYLIEFDSLGSGDGVAVQQSIAALSATPGGTFVFRLHSSGNNAALGAVSSVGQMTVQNGSITGTEDVVRMGVPGSSAITGSITAPNAMGRGTIVLNDDEGDESNYIYYVVDSNTVKLLETDSGLLGGGRADAQSSTPFSNASLNNGFAFRGRGDTLTNSFGVNNAGAFVSDGKGNIVSGSYDAVQDGNPASNVPLTGTYNVASNGRATITLNPQGLNPIPLIAWMVNSSYGFLLVNTRDVAEVGRLDQQQSGLFSAASLNGAYAFYEFGSESQTSPWLVRVGVMTFDGSSTVTFQDYFVNHSGSTAQHGPAMGNYVVSTNGRVAAFSVGSVNSQVIYLVSSDSGSLLLVASGSAMAGSIGQQVAD